MLFRSVSKNNIVKKKSPPKLLKPVVPLLVTIGKTPDFGKTMSDMKKT